MAAANTDDVDDTSSAISAASDITSGNVHEVVPWSKFDTDRVVLLWKVNPQLWSVIVPNLIDWTCDPNWPSAQVILPLLRSNPTTIAAAVPYVSDILRKCGPPGSGFERERDEEHQNVLLAHFVMTIDVTVQREMASVLKEFRDGVTGELEDKWAFRESVDELLEEMGQKIATYESEH